MKNKLNPASLELIGDRTKNFPIPYREIRWIRGIGPVEIKKLIKLGFVLEDPFKDLSPRARNVINDLELNTKSEVIDAIKSGRLKSGKGGCRNYGGLTEGEILNWVGLKKVERLCSECGRHIKTEFESV